MHTIPILLAPNNDQLQQEQNTKIKNVKYILMIRIIANSIIYLFTIINEEVAKSSIKRPPFIQNTQDSNKIEVKRKKYTQFYKKYKYKSKPKNNC